MEEVTQVLDSLIGQVPVEMSPCKLLSYVALWLQRLLITKGEGEVLDSFPMTTVIVYLLLILKDEITIISMAKRLEDLKSDHLNAES